MMPLTYQAFGARCATCQIDRIEGGLTSLGAVEGDNPDFIYANDSGWYEDAIRAKGIYPNAKLILNVLDICEHCFPNVDLSKLYRQLKQADAITVISPYVQSQIHRYLGLYSHVIWNPIKPVSPTKRLKGEKPYPQFKAAMIGRLNDSGKRSSLGIQALRHAGFNETEVAMIGPEFPGWGARMNIVSDEVLNDILNSVDFVVIPSLFEGLCLPLAESLVCGAIPIVCHDLTTLPDFDLPRYWGCYPSAYSMAYRMKYLINHPEILAKEKELALQIGERLGEKMSGKAVAQNIINIYNRLIA